ncbi:DNA polymerase III subunit delta' [Escherichia coli]|uniref:DNA polymerase III subunit delta n=1 Tax=Escherichia coli TaxID=562 RepID=A0A376TGW7_ECOLX|nr:DNA polymerase III subunit delta' [Escherichia coli]
MRWYPWLRPDFEKLVASYQAGRGHHALLIQALPGMGDDALIYALSRYLLCQQPQGHKKLRSLSWMSVDAGWHASRLLHPGSRKRGKICWALMRYVRSPKS